ncbi:MAG: hypothetical protein ACREIA_26935 [Opitutaceae bacterium]
MPERAEGSGHHAISNLNAAVALILAIAGPSTVAGITYWRVGELEKRTDALEAKIEWQNEVLWEMRADLRVLSSAARP